MKKQKKFAALILTCALIGSVLLTGCGGSNMGETVVTVDKAKVGMDEMMYYIYQAEMKGNYYEEFYQTYMGSSYWDMAYDEEKTFRDAAKEDIIESAVMYTIFEEKAKEAGYSLDAEEKETIAADAQTYFDGLSDTQKASMNLDVEDITQIQEKIALGNKYYNELMAGLDIDEEVAASRVDAEEYRQYDVAYIYIPTADFDENYEMIPYSDEDKQEAYETISELLPKAKETEDFNELIPEDSIVLEAGEISFLKGDELFGAVFEEEALKLSNGEVTDHIVEEEDGYYIIKMVNDNSTESYDEAVAAALESAEFDAFQKVYEQMKEEYTIEINNSVWDDIVIGNITYEPTAELEEEE